MSVRDAVGGHGSEVSAPFSQRIAVLAIDQQMREMLHTPGVRSVCLVDWRGGRTMTCVGVEDRAAETAAILAAITGGPLRHAGAVEDVVVTDADHHLLFAVLNDPSLCVQVRMERDEGNLGFALRRLRGLARTAQAPPSQGPPRRGGRPHTVARATTVDRSVLHRVLAALRTLAAARPRTGTAVA